MGLHHDILSRVAIVRADNYQPEYVEERISAALDLIGGIETYVKPGMKVLVKPNLLSAKGPERAITTHPEVVAAVARLVRQCGASVQIGDSPAGAKTGIERVWDNTGLSAVAERDGFELIGFERSGASPIAVDTRVYHIANPVLEADLVIGLPKLKTHVLTLMTGAVKNMFGAIPGFRKGMYHKEAPNPRHFSRVVVDIFSAVQPGLNIMDGILAMEGDGPASGRARQANLLLASTDAVAMDTVVANIIGLDPALVHTIRYAADAGLGIGWMEGISIAGESLESVRLRDFELPSNRGMELLPKFLVDLIGPLLWLRPKVDHDLCTRCGDCVTSCPVKALKRPNTKAYPELEEKLCINCWCCHEICPAKAVFIDKSWLAKRFIR